jgi:hypothetical protein
MADNPHEGDPGARGDYRLEKPAYGQVRAANDPNKYCVSPSLLQNLPSGFRVEAGYDAFVFSHPGGGHVGDYGGRSPGQTGLMVWGPTRCT